MSGTYPLLPPELSQIFSLPPPTPSPGNQFASSASDTMHQAARKTGAIGARLSTATPNSGFLPDLDKLEFDPRLFQAAGFLEADPLGPTTHQQPTFQGAAHQIPDQAYRTTTKDSTKELEPIPPRLTLQTGTRIKIADLPPEAQAKKRAANATYTQRYREKNPEAARQINRDSARIFRKKKKEEHTQLEERIYKLHEENTYLKKTVIPRLKEKKAHIIDRIRALQKSGHKKAQHLSFLSFKT